MDYESGFIALGLLEMGMVSSKSVLTGEFYPTQRNTDKQQVLFSVIG